MTLIFTCKISLAQNTNKISWFRKTFMELSFEEVIGLVETPKSVCSYVRHRVEYRSDIGDEWANGKETWDRGYGDCEDMAITVSDLCLTMGIKTKMFILYPKGSREGHAIVVGAWKGKLWFSSNGWFEKVSSLSEIKKEVSHEMGWKGRKVMVEYFIVDDMAESKDFEVSLKSLF